MSVFKGKLMTKLINVILKSNLTLCYCRRFSTLMCYLEDLWKTKWLAMNIIRVAAASREVQPRSFCLPRNNRKWTFLLNLLKVWRAEWMKQEGPGSRHDWIWTSLCSQVAVRPWAESVNRLGLSIQVRNPPASKATSQDNIRMSK